MDNKEEPKFTVNVSAKDATDIKCQQCEGLYFQSVLTFKKISKLLTGATKDSLIPIEVFRCTDCGSPLQELMPK